jgi:hypothetical protein
MSTNRDLTGEKTELSVKDRIERYFVLASVRCANCGDLHRVVELDDRVYTADDLRIDSEADWGNEMDTEDEWIRKNADAVEDVLPELEDEWGQSVHALRSGILR